MAVYDEIYPTVEEKETFPSFGNAKVQRICLTSFLLHPDY